MTPKENLMNRSRPISLVRAIVKAKVLEADWPIGRVEDLVAFNPPHRLRRGQTARYLGMKALPTEGSVAWSGEWRPFASGSRFMQWDTLFARITPSLENGKTALVDFLDEGEIAAGSTEFIVLRPREGVPAGLPYCLARSAPFRAHAAANMTGSSGRRRVPAADLAAYPLPVPRPEALAALGRALDPIFERIRIHAKELRGLDELLESLLPRLLSGELRFPTLRGPRTSCTGP